MKTIILSLLLSPLFSYANQDSLIDSKEQWEDIGVAISVAGLSCTGATAILAIYLYKPFPINDFKTFLYMSSAVFIIGALWIADGVAKLLKSRKYKRIKI